MATGRVYKDLNLNFIPNPITGDISKNVGDAAVIGAVSNIIQTNHFERPFHPEKGGNITKLLFEPLVGLTANALQKEIENTISNEEPRVTISYLSVTVNDTTDMDGYDIYMEFFIDNNPDPVAITSFLERL
jgi:phage baseplate assembly protein W